MKRCPCLLALALLAMPATTPSQAIQLNDPDGTRVVELAGVEEGDRAGYSVSGAGDFNGDGFADIIVGAYRAVRDGQPRGQAYVIFGTSDPMPPRVELGSLADGQGFTIRGAQAGDLAGMEVSGIGDINGDGLDDIAIGAPSAHTLEQEAGRVYILFGRRDGFGATVDLGELPEGTGVVLESIVRGEAGRALYGIGDFNGDGFSDLAIGAPSTRNDYGVTAGRVYVVFGSDEWPAKLSLDVLQERGRGFRIEGRRAGDRAAWSVGGGGDFNGDGFPDLLVGAPRIFNPQPLDTGEAYVVYGGPGPHEFDLSLYYLNGANGARLTGFLENQWLGTSVTAVGDLRGEGSSSILVGASKSWPGGRPDGVDEGGHVFLLAGMSEFQRAVIPMEEADLLLLQHFEGAYAGDFLGWSTAGVGDTDGDGRPDFLLSAHSADPVDANAGRVYRLSSQPRAFMSRNSMRLIDPEVVEVFEGRGRWQIAGVSVSAAGDFNGDGLADFIIGAPGGSPREGDKIGRAFLVFGKRAFQPDEASWVALHRAGAAPLTPVGGPVDGRVYPPDSRCWIGFDAGKGDGLQEVSKTTITRIHTSPSPDEPFAGVHWRIQTERNEWQSATIRLKWLAAEAEGLDATNLKVVHRTDADGEWSPVADQSLDAGRRQVTLTTSQLGEFALKVVAE
jgi:hypothetical protein